VAVLLDRGELCFSLDTLVPVWAKELVGADTIQSEDDLWDILRRAAIAGRFDKSGPRIDGCRLGLRHIDRNGRLRSVRGSVLFGTDVYLPFRAMADCIYVTKSALLAFGADPSGLPPPSGLADRRPKLPRKRGRRPTKREQVIEQMRRDITQGRKSWESLRDMLEKELEDNYGASRDTCRKAREAVLAEFPNSERTK
jgi:hypothetical protein